MSAFRFPVVAFALLLLPGALANGGGHGGHGEGEPLFDSGPIAVGAEYPLLLWREGPLAYHCHPHPWMTATVIVAAAQGPPSTWQVEIRDGRNLENYTYEPAVLYARVGDTVVWRNNGTMPHTVTSDEDAPPPKATKDGPALGVLPALALLVPLLRGRRSR